MVARARLCSTPRRRGVRLLSSSYPVELRQARRGFFVVDAALSSRVREGLYGIIRTSLQVC